MSTLNRLADAYDADLTPSGMRAMGARPLVAGDTCTLRCKAENADGSAVDLTGGTITVELRRALGDAEAALTRSSAGTSPTVVLDDQTTDNGKTGTDGRGWYAVSFGPADETITADLPLAFVGARIAYSDGSVLTLLFGKTGFVRPLPEPMPEPAP